MCDGVFFFNDTATTEIYTLSLHDALPICRGLGQAPVEDGIRDLVADLVRMALGDGLGGEQQARRGHERSEEHTSELQSRQYLVCRLLLEKKKINITTSSQHITSYMSYLFT